MHRTRLFHRILLAALTVAGLGLAACSGDDDTPAGSTGPAVTMPSGEATSGPPASGATTSPGPTPSSGAPAVLAEPDGERILDDVIELSDTIGPRAAGTDAERQAAEFIAQRLRGYGYEVELQEFGIGTQIGRSSSLSIESPAPETIPTLPIENSAARSVDGRLVFAGIGRPEDFPADTQGAIALVERGDLFFNEKVTNAAAAGAIAVVIYNNEPGIFFGSMNEATELPVVAISQESGEALKGQIEAAAVTASVSVGTVSGQTSYNVVAEPPGKDCQTVTGGHYDSVIQAPGASDNASGTATVLEIASVLAQKGATGSNCFVLFGAEELGLLGSAHYVSELTGEERGRIKAMLNFDMVGVGDEAWWFIGTQDLQERMTALVGELGIENTTPSELIRGLSSDHASFLNAGIPSLMFHRWEDPLLHTPQDAYGRVNADYLEEAARMGIALLESLAAGG